MDRNIIKDIKALQANRKGLKEFAKDKYIDNEGYANINIYINDSSIIYNGLSNPSNPDISNDITTYIENESKYIPVEYPIKLIINTNSNIDTSYIENKIKEYYWKKLSIKHIELKHNRIISTILFIIGVILLSLYFIFENMSNTKDLFNEIFSIIASFSIWESVDYAFINRGVLKIEYLELSKLALIKVEKKTL